MDAAVLSVGIACILALSVTAAHGHGTGLEVLPPVMMDGQLVTVSVDSAKDGDTVTIEVAFVRDGDREPIPNTVMLIEARRGQEPLFSEEFAAGGGVLKFEFVSDAAGDLALRSIESGGFFGILADEIHRMSGPGLAEGGLYSLDITILSVGGRAPADPPTFASAVSVPVTTHHTIVDPYWGEQSIRFITYYDMLYDMGYDADTRAVSFSMPFEWDPDVIDLVDVVHIEFATPGGLGDLLVSEFEVRINGVKVPDRAVAVDDYFVDYRTVHLVLPPGDLLGMYETIGPADTMEVVAQPASGSAYSAVTANGQYRLLVLLEPDRPVSGQEATARLNITHVFPKTLAVSVPYHVEIVHDGAVLHSGRGVSDDSSPVSIIFDVPPGASGPAAILFSDIDGNELASASLPIAFAAEEPDGAPPGDGDRVPGWVRTTVEWWAQEEIDDASFARAMAFLIESGVISVDAAPSDAKGSIEPWVRTTAQWWADGLVSDAEFLAGIAFLVERGVIPVGVG